MGQPQKKEDFVFRISRSFDTSRAKMWEAWTKPELFSLWFGPKGSTIIEASIDLRVGGGSKYGMEFAGQKMYGQWAYLEVKTPEKIVALVSFLDEKGNKIKHPMSPDWPMDIYSVVTFTEEGKNKVRIDVEWKAHTTATAAERKVFEEGMQGMNQGWSGTLDNLEEFFANRK